MKPAQLFTLVLILSCSGKPRSTEGEVSSTINKEVVCFVYHRFDDSRYPTTNVSLKDFEAHLDYLVKNNFQVLSFSEAIEYLRSNKPARKTAVITIDDGYKSFVKNGLPLLKKNKLPATLFINTKTVGGSDYMNWEELELAVNSNIEIGNHTHSHNYFLNEPAPARYKTFKDEIELSQSIILKNMKIVPRVFSYPYGEFDTEMKSIVKGAGFIGATAQYSGVIHEATDLLMCPRFPMSEAYSDLPKFIEKASMHALRTIRVSPDNFVMPAGKQPVLTIAFEKTDLHLEQLQCFVQGNECKVSMKENTDTNVTMELKAVKPISGRRRTLFTLTVPDKNGEWHWYSHLWIDSEIE